MDEESIKLQKRPLEEVVYQLVFDVSALKVRMKKLEEK